MARRTVSRTLVRSSLARPSLDWSGSAVSGRKRARVPRKVGGTPLYAWAAAVSFPLVATGLTWSVTLHVDGHAAPGSPPKSVAEAVVAQLTVIDARPDIPGYQRGRFGEAWTDHSTAEGSGNGRSTREDILARDVPGGRLLDPYTGVTSSPPRRAIHIDHLYPLAAAWDHGAASWSQDKRTAFANDVRRNLVAAGARVNKDKSDHTPAEWMPPEVSYRCWYATKYAFVAVDYGLTVSRDDAQTLLRAVATCPDEGS